MEKDIYVELIKKHLDKVKIKDNDYLNSIYYIQLSLFFEIFINKKYSIKEKFIFLNNSLNNIFLTNDCKNKIFTLFYQIQKTYFALLRFKFIILFKKSKLIVENDLSLNPIIENEKFIITILQEKKKYLFHIREILKIINSSIGHSEYFFSTAIPVKNPYNNSIFTKSNLYNIYFFMKFNNHYFSELFHSFFLCNFDLSDFINKNQYLLRNLAIHDYYKNSSEFDLLIDIEEMLEDFNYENRLYEINVDKDFPGKKLLEIMKPYLNLYLYSKYSYLGSEKIYSKRQLQQKLKDFFSYNPFFGRKIIKKIYFLKKEENENDILFIEDHISFYKNNRISNCFLESHYSIINH